VKNLQRHENLDLIFLQTKEQRVTFMSNIAPRTAKKAKEILNKTFLLTLCEGPEARETTSG